VTAVRYDRVEHAVAALRAAFVAAHPAADLTLVERACHAARDAHHGQRRRNGDPFVLHPITVAAIVANAGADAETVCAAALHDVVEDTPFTLSRLETEFGSRIAALVRDQADMAAVNRAVADSTGAGADILLIKLADRLHNMRTLSPLDPDQRRRRSQEVIEFFLPLAERLGHPSIGRELELLARNTLRRTTSARVIDLASSLLPRAARHRWIEEWTAELATLPSRRRRAGFAWQVLRASPRLAAVYRGDRAIPRTNRTTITAVTGLVTALTALVTALAAIFSPAGPPTWALATVIIAGLALLAAILFATDDRAARRLIEMIRAWRNTM
jgi:hypothetical protein